jgi:hypothetical protein
MEEGQISHSLTTLFLFFLSLHCTCLVNTSCSSSTVYDFHNLKKLIGLRQGWGVPERLLGFLDQLQPVKETRALN